MYLVPLLRKPLFKAGLYITLYKIELILYNDRYM